MAMKIVFIHDDSAIREMLGMMLTGEGHEVVLAENGNDGLQKLKTSPEINLIISDIIMPEKEGVETITEIRESYPDIKILAISGGGTVQQELCLSIAKLVGADHTLGKPFLKKDLTNAIDRVFA